MTAHIPTCAEEGVCGGCNQGQCPPLGSCPGGITWDACGCCEVCAKSLGEECGGPYSAYGQCGLGLTCLKDQRECPYLFHPQGLSAYGNTDVCKQYLFNAIGRCVQERRLRIRGFSLLKG
ncbi:insulin-like growth factor-binding protein 7 [Hyalella azteca]|uniref:Insulin-like growth factor-binding protein 7 n=1 Tax=Hyalella azteca TaxID=294128 RepID=A0A979FJ82_HYAAZ|nr:insulin-like growth factor-binding protein 7 [Hyalella azteca]